MLQYHGDESNNDNEIEDDEVEDEQFTHSFDIEEDYVVDNVLDYNDDDRNTVFKDYTIEMEMTYNNVGCSPEVQVDPIVVKDIKLI